MHTSGFVPELNLKVVSLQSMLHVWTGMKDFQKGLSDFAVIWLVLQLQTNN